MKRDTQLKARTVVRAYIDAADETGKEFARRADVCKATIKTFPTRCPIRPVWA